MRPVLKWTFSGALVLVLFIVGAWALRVELAELAYDIALNQLDQNPSANLVDGIHVYVCGAGSPLPDPKRGGSCLGVLAGDDAFVFDAGSGASRTLTMMGFPFDKLQRIYITHYHSDHIDGLGELLLQAWIAGRRTSPITVAGPVGIETVLDGFLHAYSLDRDYRIAHHGADVADEAGFGGVASTFAFASDHAVVYDVNDVMITAFDVDHRPVMPAVGYRVDYGSRSVVISGDTAHDERVIVVARNADLLIHEALNREMVKKLERLFVDRGSTNNATIMHDIQDYHASPVEAAQIAQRAGVRELLLYHIIPPLRIDLLKPMFLDGANDYFDGKVTIAEDGVLISMPSGSDSITHNRLGS